MSKACLKITALGSCLQVLTAFLDSRLLRNIARTGSTGIVNKGVLEIAVSLNLSWECNSNVIRYGRDYIVIEYITVCSKPHAYG